MSMIYRLFDALALVFLGGFMVWLPLSGPYWHYLNPRFELLTAFSGAVLLLLGGVRLFAHSHGHGVFRSFIALCFTGLCLWSVSGNSVVDMEEDLSFSDVSRSSRVEEVVARESFAGKEYLRMNVAEAFSLLQSGRGQIAKDVVLRGMLLEGKGPDGSFYVVLSRVAIICCLADAVGAGIVLEGNLPVPEGQWVKVYGRLVESASGNPSFELPGVVAAVVPPDYLLAVDHIEKCDVPSVPFIFEFRDAEPFAY